MGKSYQCSTNKKSKNLSNELAFSIKAPKSITRDTFMKKLEDVAKQTSMYYSTVMYKKNIMSLGKLLFNHKGLEIRLTKKPKYSVIKLYLIPEYKLFRLVKTSLLSLLGSGVIDKVRLENKWRKDNNG